MSGCFPSSSPGKAETHAQHNDVGMELPWRVATGNQAREPKVKTCPGVRPGPVGARRGGGAGVLFAYLPGSKVRLEPGFTIYPLLEGKLAK